MFKKGAETPLRVTRRGLETQRYWNHDVLVYVFDPTRVTDLIDMWNLRLEPRPVVPVPVQWIESLAGEIREIIKQEFRPLRGNPHGVMHHPTIEFGRSIAKEKVDELVDVIRHVDLPQGSLSIKPWRNRIWEPQFEDHPVARDSRLEVTAEERRTTLLLRIGRELSVNFENSRTEVRVTIRRTRASLDQLCAREKFRAPGEDRDCPTVQHIRPRVAAHEFWWGKHAHRHGGVEFRPTIPELKPEH